MKPSLVIVGLGNPGGQHERTRHNVGFRAVDLLSEEVGEGKWTEKQKFLSVAREARVVTVPVLLVKPQTYMNRSGEAVRKLVDFYKLDPSEQLLVLTDDIDLPLGDLRFRKNGGPGTHNGMRSIVDAIGEAFPRIRIGLGAGAPGVDLAAWVLSIPPGDEEKTIEDAVRKIPEMVREYVLGKANH